MWEKMEKMSELVQENISKAQRYQKKWYDQNAREREFNEGDLVLMLLPTSTNKLLAHWEGPYTILKQMGKVNRMVDMHDHRKRKRTFHTNMLRQRYVPESTGYYAEEVDDIDSDDVPVWKEHTNETLNDAVLGDKLIDTQQSELKEMLEEYLDVMRNEPSKTNLAEHNIVTSEARPVRLPPYRLPHAYTETVQQELKDMLDHGIIEPSSSERSSPILLVKRRMVLYVCELTTDV